MIIKVLLIVLLATTSVAASAVGKTYVCKDDSTGEIVKQERRCGLGKTEIISKR